MLAATTSPWSHGTKPSAKSKTTSGKKNRCAKKHSVVTTERDIYVDWDELYNLALERDFLNGNNIISRHSQLTCHDLDKLDRTMPVDLKKKLKLPTGRHFFRCYQCNRKARNPHPVYIFCCYKCGDLNKTNRELSRHLKGMIALVTGGRTKLGHQVVLKLLRAGCAKVIATTRTPEKALELFKGYDENRECWSVAQNLIVEGLDFDNPDLDSMIECFVEETLKKKHRVEKVDILVNCAAQTIRARDKPTEKNDTNHQNVQNKSNQDGVTRQLDFNSQTKRATGESALSGQENERTVEINTEEVLEDTKSSQHEHEDTAGASLEQPTMEQNRYGDSRFVKPALKNSWLMRIEDFDQMEAEECFRINAIAPAKLIQKLLPLLQEPNSAPDPQLRGAFVVNVHAREGLLGVDKDDRHIHTNMAKCALHMITRCLAKSKLERRMDLSTSPSSVSDSVPISSFSSGGEPPAKRAKKRIVYFHGVDPGFVSVDEYYEESRPCCVPPLDERDGAARILFPVFRNLESTAGKTRRHFWHLVD